MVLKNKSKGSVQRQKRKGKKWKKGHSCVSNPEIKTHRKSAKNRFFNVVSEPSGLTQEALARHDDDNDDDVMPVDQSDDTSTTGNTFSTWASNWTECTNVTFSKVHRYWTSNSASHKSILAVLAAITEVIKANDGQETDTEYFGALMTALEGQSHDPDSLAAITYLLHLCMKRLPSTVLKSKFSDVAKVLVAVLAEHVNTETTAVARNTLRCLGQLLRVQDQSVWSHSSTTNVYHAILSFIVHGKPKVRKSAHEAVAAILHGSSFMVEESTAPSSHPAASTTAKYCTEQIEAAGGSGDATVTMHTLGLLQDILSVLPSTGLKSVCETILKVMTLANVMVTSVSMKCLHKMFASRPKPTSLSAELNAQIITALYDYQPGDTDTQLMSAWLALLKEAHSNLARLNSDLFLNHIPRYFAVAMQCLKGTHQDVAHLASNSIKSILTEDLRPLADKLGTMTAVTDTPIHKLFATLANGLGYQYHASWGLVMELLAAAFEVLGKTCSSIMIKCLHTLSELRNSHRFLHKGALDKAVGVAVKTMGPRTVLTAIPLNITGDQDNYDFPQSWLLPILRDNVRETELAFFTGYFLPLAAKLRLRALDHSKHHRTVEAKTYNAIQLQIWSLLPGFCNKPTDLVESFKGLAKVLGAALRDREDIRMDILAAVRKLVLYNLDHEDNKVELARFAKNYLPLFFNVFTTQPEKDKDPVRLAVLETVKVYAKISDQQLIGTYLDMCHSKVDEKDISTFRRHALLDLLIGLVPYADSTRLTQILVQTVTHLEDTDRTVQKKSYRILEEICSSTQQDCLSFVASHLDQLQNSLLSALSSANPSAKAPRLRCLIHIISQLEEEDTSFIEKVVPEAVLCTKETAEKARQAAYSLLIQMVQALFRWNPTTPKAGVLERYYHLILSGLAGKPHVIVCTLQAITRLAQHYKDYMSDDLVHTLMDSTCLLLKSKAREIVTASIGLLRVLLAVFDDLTLGQYIQTIISSLVTLKEDNRHHLRFKTKEILTKLVRKFGYNVIISHIPPSHHKVLANIRKTQERVKRHKQSAERTTESGDQDTGPKAKPESFAEFLADSDSDMDADDNTPKPGGRKTKRGDKRRQEGAAWLQEEGAVIDFLDPSVSQRVTATKPKKSTNQKKASSGDSAPFKTAADGRLIIKEESDDEAQSRHKGQTAPPIDDLDELLDAFEGAGKKKSCKRKISGGEDAEDEGHMSYKAGGSGIHRPLKKAGSEYSSKKAGGDIKKSGKHDPYAYLPLNIANLNKRKKAKVQGQFKGLVRGAKKGALKGKKMRAKNRK